MSRAHAVVLGAGISGLLAARALAGHYERVTVVDRDDLPAGPAHRKGTPQDRHPHLLLARGARVLEELHPGLLADMVLSGAPVLRTFRDTHLDFCGHLLSRQGATPEPMYLPTRTALEAGLRARTARHATLRAGTTATDLIQSDGKVVGVGLETAAGREELGADLVVDATGRSGRAAAWLPALGFPAPAEDRVEVDVCYVSAFLDLPEHLQRAILVSATPARPWGIAGGRTDGDRGLVTAYGYRGHHPSTDYEGIVDAFAELAPPGWLEALLETRPERVAVHRYPCSIRRRYEKLRAFPQGLLVVGDGLCSFNPLYGQGMTVAALQALTLRQTLAGGDRDLARRFFTAAARDVDVAWRLSVCGDLAYPCVPGPRPPWVAVVNRGTDAVLSAAESDTRVRDGFLRVSWLLDPPSRLAHPAFAARVLRHRFRAPRAPEAPAATPAAAAHAGPRR
ncbi:MAG TPA: NAD(P)-binding protein [Sporichthyaceae bacterium]|jgi:2-polyprenyl-6-methoxyphenol hydroxylase-like FAD-dependent oxidoreductase|nr:NAD(P)-binding protein [Sporichthyaceae bacterium]